MKYLFLWGHTAKNKSEAEKACLNQWYEAAFIIDDIDYPTAEHYMMAEKAHLFNDKEALENILIAKSPADAKNPGREVKDYEGTFSDLEE